MPVGSVRRLRGGRLDPLRPGRNTGRAVRGDVDARGPRDRRRRKPQPRGQLAGLPTRDHSPGSAHRHRTQRHRPRHQADLVGRGRARSDGAVPALAGQHPAVPVGGLLAAAPHRPNRSSRRDLHAAGAAHRRGWQPLVGRSRQLRPGHPSSGGAHRHRGHAESGPGNPARLQLHDGGCHGNLPADLRHDDRTAGGVHLPGGPGSGRPARRCLHARRAGDRRRRQHRPGGKCHLCPRHHPAAGALVRQRPAADRQQPQPALEDRRRAPHERDLPPGWSRRLPP